MGVETEFDSQFCDSEFKTASMKLQIKIINKIEGGRNIKLSCNGKVCAIVSKLKIILKNG